MYPMMPLEATSAMQCIAALFTILSALFSLYFCRA